MQSSQKINLHKDTPRPEILIIILERFQTSVNLLHTHPQVVYFKFVVSSVSALTLRKSCAYKIFGQTDGLTDRGILVYPHKTFV